MVSGNHDLSIHNIDLRIHFPSLILLSISENNGEAKPLTEIQNLRVHASALQVTLFEPISLSQLDRLCRYGFARHFPEHSRACIFGIQLAEAVIKPKKRDYSTYYFGNITKIILRPGAGILPFRPEAGYNKAGGGVRLHGGGKGTRLPPIG
jgi:hypothetical protein